MRMLLPLRPPPPAVANHLSTVQSRPPPLLRSRRAAGPPPPSAAAAEFPAGPVPGAGAQMPPRRRRTVAGIDQDDLLDPEALADPDSCFYEINGVRVHHKVCAHDNDGDQSPGSSVARTKIGLPIVLLHGFGASVFSWSRVMRPLARIAGAKVLAFDRPAFGLTSRAGWSGDDTKPLNPYSMAFSVMATLAFIDQLGTGKAVLVGHSAGCSVAVEAYFEAPERVAALVLVAPAIFAPSKKGNPDSGVGEQQGPEDKDSDDSSAPSNPFARIWTGFLGMFMWLAGLILKAAMAVQDMVSALSRKVLVAFLRSSLAAAMVRLVMDKFGVTGVHNAWYDPSKVTDHVIQGYTKPLRSRGWEKALLEHTISMITDTPKSKVPVSKRLSEISCPVLVVTGDTDRLVPASNAERLARAIPGATFEVIKNCGHLPQEERAEEFLSAVERFLQGAFGTPVEQMFQPAV
ncbi:dihydrolipoyllysine-residue acetyltransferase component of acetoin cleaving system-like [Lolium rigidum]|uniref:dihydrolipoyllysine-residue acetyltransferase component of acetoin cleaving system-like n=1 Tax=Lolium rigidum TaxID=89674 RepID=UPI001F5C5916|nr:dihydrolipoyllysine-residue acetyltransferase component of acetoin cleaving system-like [Lolium rigidum]